MGTVQCLPRSWRGRWMIGGLYRNPLMLHPFPLSALPSPSQLVLSQEAMPPPALLEARALHLLPSWESMSSWRSGLWRFSISPEAAAFHDAFMLPLIARSASFVSLINTI